MITFEVDDTKAIARLNAMPEGVRKALAKKVTALSLALEAKVKAKLSGEMVNVVTGRLRRSIHSTTNQTATSVVGKVASSGDVPYARIIEQGGKTAAHDIFPVKAKALHFMKGGADVFAKVVHHPGSTFKPRPYMRDSLKEMTPEIEAGLREAVAEGLRE